MVALITQDAELFKVILTTAAGLVLLPIGEWISKRVPEEAD